MWCRPLKVYGGRMESNVNGSLRSANPCHEKMARTGTFLVLFAQLSTIEFGYESSNKQKTESRS